ncbi:MAG: putative DNA binding domain-containing protein [bacterium]|nr:putative DNA binding domain-containing protein [bacterium]
MTTGLQPQVDEAVRHLRQAGTDLQNIEVKAASGGLPRSAKESVSAFANTRGGIIILGLSDGDFLPVPIDAAKLAADLASVCANEVEPPIRAEFDIAHVEGRPVVAALVEELPTGRKPCFVKSKGMESGSYIRTHDGDYRLSSYEIHILVSGRGQPLDDMAVVGGASVADLDDGLVASLLNRIRNRRGQTMASQSDTDVLKMLGVIVGNGHEPSITLAGLMTLGRFPQQFVPQLNVTFVAFPTVTGRPLEDGTRFLDNEPIDGPIPAMVAGALAAVRRNITRRSVVTGAGRLDVWEYPDEAVREIVGNALMHRDYHPSSHGSQVRIELYPDRLEVVNPGGLHGEINRDHLFSRPVTSSRNSRLAKLLEDIEIPSTNTTVCENRGSGLLAVAASLQNAGLHRPVFEDSIRNFTVKLQGATYPLDHSSGSRHDNVAQRSSRESPRDKIRALLTKGPLPAKDLVEELGMSRGGVLRWLRIMERDGEIETTEAARRSPRNRWQLVVSDFTTR